MSRRIASPRTSAHHVRGSSTHASSHGFRPGRSCHTAIAEAKQHVEDGNEWVVDIDLERFFDRVHHQRLLARLEQKVADRRLLALVLRMLKAKVVMPNGVVVSTEEGVPQGGPLFSLRRKPLDGEVEVLLSEQSKRRIDEKIRELTPRT